MINGERGPKVGASLSYRNVKERVIIGSVLYICSGLAPSSFNFLAFKNFSRDKLEKSSNLKRAPDSPQKQSNMLVKDVFPLLFRPTITVEFFSNTISISSRSLYPSTLTFSIRIVPPKIHWLL